MRKFIGHPDLKIKMFSGNGNKTFPDFICTYGLLCIYGCYAPNVTSNNNTLTSVKRRAMSIECSDKSSVGSNETFFTGSTISEEMRKVKDFFLCAHVFPLSPSKIKNHLQTTINRLANKNSIK